MGKRNLTKERKVQDEQKLSGQMGSWEHEKSTETCAGAEVGGTSDRSSVSRGHVEGSQVREQGWGDGKGWACGAAG